MGAGATSFVLKFVPDPADPSMVETTNDILFGADASVVQAELEMLPGIGAGGQPGDKIALVTAETGNGRIS